MHEPIHIEYDLDDTDLPMALADFWINEEDAKRVAAALHTAFGDRIAERKSAVIETADLNESLVRLGIAHARTMEFRYSKGSGAVIETRRLVPAAITDVGDHKTIVGYDPDRDEPRAYRLDRIKGTIVLT